MAAQKGLAVIFDEMNTISGESLHELSDKTIIFFKENKYNELLKKYEINLLFNLWIENLSCIDIVTLDSINNIVTLSKEKLNIAGKNLFIPLRLSLIGQEHGPDLFTIINIIGIRESINRIKSKL